MTEANPSPLRNGLYNVEGRLSGVLSPCSRFRF